MAIYHLHVSIVSRKTGRSAVAAAAYRAAEKLHNEYDGITHNYTRKSGVVHSEIMLPHNAPQEFTDRHTLWNAVEKVEKRCDAQTAREIDIALPIEFSRQEQLEIVREYIQENFVSHGMCADFAIHNKGDGNPHAHILLTTRNISENGFEGKNRDWNNKSRLEQWREHWADICNERLQKKGLDERIDHRTLKAQGIDREPNIHIGVAAVSMERAGRNSDRIRKYHDIAEQCKIPTHEETAEYMHELKQGYIILDKEISALKQEADDMRREIQSLRIRSEHIEERTKQINEMKGRLEELKTERQGKGIFASKQDIDKRIQHLERSHEQSLDYFKRQYYIAPNEAAAEIKRLQYKSKDFEQAQERLRNKLTPLESDKETFMLEYQRHKLLAEINPNGQDILEKLAQLGKENSLERQSPQDRLARTQNERMLDIVAQSNFQEILNEISSEQARILIERRECEMERDHSRELRFKQF